MEKIEVVKRADEASTSPRPAPALVAPAEKKAANVLEPVNVWPPPIYIDENAPPEERYYMEHRWYTQWNWYDTRAASAKRSYQRLQLIIGIGSLAIPALVGLNPLAEAGSSRTALTLLTVFISVVVAAATAIENVKKHGDAWRSYRTAAEELKREKSLYDVRSGSYRKSKKPFLLFVERCEDIMAKQNGSWSAALLKEDTAAATTGQPSRDDDAEDTP